MSTITDEQLVALERLAKEAGEGTSFLRHQHAVFPTYFGVPHTAVILSLIARLRRTEAERDEARAHKERLREALHALTDGLDCACMGLSACAVCDDLARARAALAETGGG